MSKMQIIPKIPKPVKYHKKPKTSKRVKRHNRKTLKIRRQQGGNLTPIETTIGTTETTGGDGFVDYVKGFFGNKKVDDKVVNIDDIEVKVDGNNLTYKNSNISCYVCKENLFEKKAENTYVCVNCRYCMSFSEPNPEKIKFGKDEETETKPENKGGTDSDSDDE